MIFGQSAAVRAANQLLTTLRYAAANPESAAEHLQRAIEEFERYAEAVEKQHQSLSNELAAVRRLAQQR